MDVARVDAEEELELESPIEADLRVERPFRRDHRLVQHKLIAPVVEGPAEILIIVRATRVPRNTAFDPAINIKTRLGSLDDLLLFRQLRRSERLSVQPTCGDKREADRENSCELRGKILLHDEGRPLMLLVRQ